jgi:hypothetical protein
MNASKALDTLTERVRVERSKGTIHGVLAAKARTLTMAEAERWMSKVGLHVFVHNKPNDEWSKTLTAAVRQAEQRASKKPKIGTQLKLATKGGRK